MDANERAKRTANGQKKSSSNSTTTQTTRKQLPVFKATESTFTHQTVRTEIDSNISFDLETKTGSIVLPNIQPITVTDVADRVKTTTLLDISDVRNPGITEDRKADKATFERAKNDYEDGIRYEQLIVWANTYIGEQYKAIASQAKAYQQGLIAASEIEKVYQQFLELAKQKQITTEKTVNYIAQSHKTATTQTALPYTMAENESNLEKQRIKAKKGFEEAKQGNVEFDDWLTSLKGKQAVK